MVFGRFVSPWGPVGPARASGGRNLAGPTEWEGGAGGSGTKDKSSCGCCRLLADDSLLSKLAVVELLDSWRGNSDF